VGSRRVPHVSLLLRDMGGTPTTTVIPSGAEARNASASAQSRDLGFGTGRGQECPPHTDLPRQVTLQASLCLSGKSPGAPCLAAVARHGFWYPANICDYLLKALTAAVSSSLTSKTVYSLVICSRS